MTEELVKTDNYHPWTTYLWASEEARRPGDRKAGTDHLLLGLLQEPIIVEALRVSLTDARCALDGLDKEALGKLGIELENDPPPLLMHPIPNPPTLRAVIKGRLRMTPVAKKTLKDAGKPMRRGKHISPREVLNRILDLKEPDPAIVLLDALGVNISEIRPPKEI